MFNFLLPLISLLPLGRTPIDTAPIMRNGKAAVQTVYSDGSVEVTTLGCPGCAGGYARTVSVFVSGSRQVFDMVTVEAGDTNPFDAKRGLCYPKNETCQPGTTEEDKCLLTVQAQIRVAPTQYTPTIWCFNHHLQIWGRNVNGGNSYWTVPFVHTSQCGEAATIRDYTVVVVVVPFLPTTFTFSLRAQCLPCEAFVR